ncbi:hypothetical protein KUTeg_000956 [Tegillarca granosa]|uniref:FLYWCH-type domain-containing protein n=1 Tax=Tegillarca granosa TaxID=220873 RepID=A0ABQ9FZN1_TEGGR|nr:hypothetical protein KUTeg_000956 [Tegillarca granosa]
MPPRRSACIVCKATVRPKQHAFQCETCQRWQHRTCNTGIDVATYWETVRGNGIINWWCRECGMPENRFSETVSVTEEPMAIEDNDIGVPDQESTRLSLSVIDQRLDDIAPETSPVSYQVLDTGSKRGKPKLVDSHGYTYTVNKETNAGKIYWWCSVRGKHKRCPATVLQTTDTYQPGVHPHSHPGVPGIQSAANIEEQVKSAAVADVFRSASEIVEEVLAEIVDLREPEGARPKIPNLVRNANRARQRLRPPEPQNLDFEVAYNERDDIHKFIRKLFALPLLPAEHIPDAFEELSSGSHPTQIVELLNNIHDNWMTSSVWTVSSWSVFNMSVRTNNDVEGWHRRINDRAHGSTNVPFYLLIQLLHREAKCLPTQIKLICEGKLKRVQRKSTLKLFKKLHSLWNAYENGEVSTSHILKRCGRIYAPMT